MFGLIAGDGRLPLEVARAARRAGRDVAALGIRDITDPALAAEVTTLHWVRLGEVGAMLSFLRDAGVSEAVMAGKVSKEALYTQGGLELDARARELLSGLVDLSDLTILAALAELLAREGICLRPQAELVPELVAREGVLGAARPTRGQLQDVAFAWPIARTLAGLDIGQTVVVRKGVVIAVEASEGTDAAIRRGGELAGEGTCVVKVARPDQDPRFDVPAIGSGTLDALADARAALLAVEAGRTLVLEEAELGRRADELGIALLGIGRAGPPEPSGARDGARQ